MTQALHSTFNEGNYKKACGLALLPLRTQTNGPAPITKERDIIDEAIEFFRANVLFKSFDIKGPADCVLVYLLVCLSHCFKITENEYIHREFRKLEQGAKKKLSDLVADKIPRPKEQGYFMSSMLENMPMEVDLYAQYVRQLKEELAVRFLQKFYEEGMQIEDFKFWCGLSKKKFMGYNFTAGF